MTEVIASESMQTLKPFIPAETVLPEITCKGVILGVLLAILLAASSTFLGLKIARTISASIPAALISMLVLRRFKSSNILENNMVQTIASAGEVVAAGVIFTLPALIITRYWEHFDYWQTALITMIGGVLGVLFSVPLRRSMVIEEGLPYPEGVATAEILKAGESTGESTKILLFGVSFSAVIAFLQTALKVAGEQVQYWVKIGSTAMGASLALSPVLMAAGYIVGLRALLAFVVGGVLTWCVAIPFFVSHYGLPEGVVDLAQALSKIQKDHFRYVGVGVMTVGGLWSVISLFSQIRRAIKMSLGAIANKTKNQIILRTDKDIAFKYVGWGILGISIPTFLLFMSLVEKSGLTLSTGYIWGTVIFATLFALVIGFVASSIASYVVGVVGSTSLPISGIGIAAILGFSGVLLVFWGNVIDFQVNQAAALQASALVILFAAVICVAAAVGGDNMQDLKAGQLVGSTPWRQQWMLLVGAITSALVIPFILETTFQAYGIGEVLPRVGMDPMQALAAPQATLMATVAHGVFSGNLPWHMIQLGVGLGILAISLDEYLKRRQSHARFPVLTFALGIYLPFSYVTAFLIGGLLNLWVEKAHRKNNAIKLENGVLFASGVIAGEAILGALLTIPFAYKQSTEVFALSLPGLESYTTAIGVALFMALCFYQYKQATKI